MPALVGGFHDSTSLDEGKAHQATDTIQRQTEVRADAGESPRTGSPGGVSVLRTQTPIWGSPGALPGLTLECPKSHVQRNLDLPFSLHLHGRAERHSSHTCRNTRGQKYAPRVQLHSPFLLFHCLPRVTRAAAARRSLRTFSGNGGRCRSDAPGSAVGHRTMRSGLRQQGRRGHFKCAPDGGSLLVLQ